MDAFQVIEMSFVSQLRTLLDGGLDPHLERDGWTLLTSAIEVEIDAHTQTGDELHVDMTSLLIARGANPFHVPQGGISAEHLAFQRGHWLALEVCELVRSRFSG